MPVLSFCGCDLGRYCAVPGEFRSALDKTGAGDVGRKGELGGFHPRVLKCQEAEKWWSWLGDRPP